MFLAVSVGEVCSVQEDQREDCGSYGIGRDDCLALDCCWQPGVGRVPWCYKGKNQSQAEGRYSPKIYRSVTIAGHLVGLLVVYM